MEEEPVARTWAVLTASELKLLSTLVVLIGAGVFLALPFVLRSGAEFFLPMTTALMLSIALAPLADLMGRSGLPNALASAAALLLLMIAVTLVALSILQPSLDLIARLPRLARTMADRLDDLRGGFRDFAQIAEQLGRITGTAEKQEVVVATPSMIEQLAFSTPSVVFQTVLTLLLTFFLLEGRVRLKRKLMLDRADFGASLRAARVLRDVQEQVATYIATALMIGFCVGVIVGLGAWAFGLESPVMWGGLAALLNLLPYIGPLSMVVLLGAFGLGTESSLLGGLAPALCYLALHTVEANLVTPMILGRRFTLSPIAVLAAIMYFSWVWGVAGVFLSIPLFLTILALFHHLGSPNVVGFLFGEPLFAELGDDPPQPPDEMLLPGQDG